MGLYAVACGGTAPSGSVSVAGPTSTASASQSPPSARPPATGGAQLVSTHQVDGRAWDLTVRSPAVGTDVHVRLLLPSRFTSAPDERWPVLYLLHGCCDSYVSWTRSTDIERLSRELDALVVMPDGGKAGFYSDWISGPHWETFHLQELPSLLEERYRANDRRVVAGVSMGGLGSLGYAARHPGMFTVAASFSGIVNTRLAAGESQAYLGLLQSQGEDPHGLWGDPDADVDVWRAHNPYDLAEKLAGTRLYISAGSGQPGPLDSADATFDQTESALRAENEVFVRRVRELHIDAQIDLYSPGTHKWVYWQRELHKAWPLLSDGLHDG
ncbi:alpha/beta hydrolase family protein [Kribbella sp. VKM Ac-2568]|uniref:alpha/beta hydrolase n=1 Tax=Kribbella sp. VKM Ac-2568 TaxID=2512219 RepID=UPI001F53F0ED|nr:alpha/beta hydrolase family protein [Kribbella sp. VKM Ac-2568]